ncbi:MAG: YraN family protein [Flavobacteriales bacterium]|nr:YraN family protein [Flavobacteriales bacterium]MCX7768852.1 YraN family protein [Flavobacteriales bacterium]MDW8410874.1 YraN family protein [Flavobacteriales bacterium]
MNRRARGREAEEAAVAYLEQQGYRILHRNLRLGRLEVDIIAHSGDTLVFVEVKTASADLLGTLPPLKPAQEERLRSAAELYLQQFQGCEEVRFDLITAFRQDREWKIHHILDAFGPLH